MLFQCPHARATWFISPLSLRTGDLNQQSIHTILEQLWGEMQQSQIAMFMSIAWQIWKARCAHLFHNKIYQLENTINQINYNYSPPPEGPVITNMADTLAQ